MFSSDSQPCHPDKEAKDRAKDAVRLLLKQGGDFDSIATLAQHHSIDYKAIATELVKKDEIDDDEGTDAMMNLEMGLLSRSSSIVEDNDFFEKIMQSLEDSADKDLEDPIMMNVITNPIMLSSGTIMDRDSCFNENGKLRYLECPLTRLQLKEKVYNVNLL